MTRKLIKIAFTDFPGPTHIELLMGLLSERYSLQLSNEPDYVIYSVFGSEYLRFSDSVRIQFITENLRPDFNLCDYAMSFDWLAFGDRYFRAPNFVLYPEWQDLLSRKSSCLSNLSSKPDFCNFIYSNGNGHPVRGEFFRALNEIVPVDSLGSYLRNSDRLVSRAYASGWSSAKVETQRSYRFTIAFENSATPGYTTEKIVHALSADTVPIYWGDPEVSRIFNPERIINVQSLGIQGSISRILELQNDCTALLSVLNQPFFSEGADIRALERQALLTAFSRILDQPKSQAWRRDEYAFTRWYERTRRAEISSLRAFSRLMTPLVYLKRLVRFGE